MYISDMSYDEVLEERKDIERRLIHKVIRNKKVTIYELKEGHNRRYLSYSPYTLRNTTNLDCSRYTGYKYSHLSNELHKYADERYEIEEKIHEIIPFKKIRFIHLLFAEDFETYTSTKNYCNENGIAMISKLQYKEVCKLINKWRSLSSDLHYKMTKQEKRKLKKLFRRLE